MSKWSYEDLKKYQMVLRELRESIDDLDPDVSRTEDMIGALDYIPKLINKLREIYDEVNNK